MELTIREINEKRQLLAQITLAGDNATNVAADKLNYAIAKLNKRFDSSVRAAAKAFSKGPAKVYNEALEDVRIDTAAVYPDDFEAKEKRGLYVLNPQSGYLHTKQGTKDFNVRARVLNDAFAAEQDAYEDTKVEIVGEKYFADSAPRAKEISLFIKEELAGLLFEESQGENQESRIKNQEEESGSGSGSSSGSEEDAVAATAADLTAASSPSDMSVVN